MPLRQQDRLLSIDTQLGRDALLLVGLRGREGLSIPFEFELEMISPNHGIAFRDIVGTRATIGVTLADGDQRWLHGMVARFAQGRGGDEAGGDPRYSFYTATLVPWLWLLTRTMNLRIFQNLSAVDIIERVFREKGFTDYDLRLHEQYPVRDYCVQYRETDFNLVSRLLEEEGIYYFFEHERDRHTLVLADAPEEHRPCPFQSHARYRGSAGSRLEEDLITSLEHAQEIMEGRCTLHDFNFETPASSLRVEVAGRHDLGPGEREWYDYPGRYSRRSDGDRLVNLRMQERECRITNLGGTSTCRGFATGHRFELRDHFRQDLNNRRFVLTEVIHEASQGAGYPGAPGRPGDFSYTNRFRCIPHEVPFRPPLTARKPVVQGCQTAIVVGPEGEEIYTDRYGRVKVQFHWDREGRYNENSSCWVRVSQPWAGAGWGGVAIPRIGHEVIVDFLEGDPDRPIITGRVYHGHNLPPYELPGRGVVSGMKSNSTPGGGGYNEISMDDSKGSEKITIHAQYDLNGTVEHDQTLKVKHDRTVTVTNNRATTVEQGNDTLTVATGQRTVTVTGNSSHTVTAGNRSVAVTSGGYALGAAQGIALQAQAAGIGIVGGGQGVTISGTPNLEASGAARAVLSSPDIDIGNGVIKIHGSKIEITAGASQIVIDAGKIVLSSGSGQVQINAAGVTVTGALVKIN